MSTTPIFQAALDRGLSIIPIPPGEKGCKMPLWQELAAPDDSLMLGCDGYNYGVVANDTFCILDIDSPERFHGELGIKLPKTYTVATSLGVFDFQAVNKYVVGEGSTHPSGHVYTCTDPSPIVAIPDSLVGKQRLANFRNRVSVTSRGRREAAAINCIGLSRVQQVEHHPFFDPPIAGGRERPFLRSGYFRLVEKRMAGTIT